MKCRGEVHTKELCMERSDHDMGGGLKEWPKLCVLKEPVSEGFEVRSEGRTLPPSPRHMWDRDNIQHETKAHCPLLPVQ